MGSNLGTLEGGSAMEARPKVEIQHMPPEIMEHIFCYLDVSSKQKASQVCTKWRDIIYQPFFWNQTCVRIADDWPNPKLYDVLSDRGIGHMNMNYLDFEERGFDDFVHHIAKLDSLTLCDCTNVTTRNLAMAFFKQSLPQLNKLCLIGKGYDPDAFIFMLVTNCPNLVTLRWLADKELTISSMQNIAARMHKLETLYLHGHTYGLTGGRMRYLTSSDQLDIVELPSIKSLSLCYAGLSKRIFTTISQMSSLETLIINRCLNISQNAMECLNHGRAPITALHLANLYQAAANDCMLPVSKMKHLKKLSLKFTDITWEGIRTLSSESSQISNLQIRLCHCLNNMGLRQVAKLTCLSELSLGPSFLDADDHITDFGLFLLVQSTAPIQFLSLNFLPYFTNVGLQHLSRMRHLRRLHITKCRGISFKGLANLAENEHSNLLVLDVSDCTQINNSLCSTRKYPKLQRCLILQPPLPTNAAPPKCISLKSRACFISPWASPAEARFRKRDILAVSYCDRIPQSLYGILN